MHACMSNNYYLWCYDPTCTFTRPLHASSVFPLLSLETRTLDMQSCGSVIQHYTNARTLTTSLWILRLPVCSCIKLPAPLTRTHTLQVLEQYQNLWFCYSSLVHSCVHAVPYSSIKFYRILTLMLSCTLP